MINNMISKYCGCFFPKIFQNEDQSERESLRTSSSLHYFTKVDSFESLHLGEESMETNRKTSVREYLEECGVIDVSYSSKHIITAGCSTFGGAIVGACTVTVLYELFRNLTWAAFKELGLDYSISQSDDPNGRIYGQLLHSTIAMIGVCFATYVILFCKGYFSPPPKDSQSSNQAQPSTEKECWKNKGLNDVKSIIGLASVIPSFDLATNTAIEYLKELGYTDTTANYMAAIVSGPTAGLTKYMVIKLADAIFDLFTGREGLNRLIKKPPLESLGDIVSGLILNGTLGAIPGAVWQLVYTMCVDYEFAPYETGLLVALCVATTAVLFGILENKRTRYFHLVKTRDVIISNESLSIESDGYSSLSNKEDE